MFNVTIEIVCSNSSSGCALSSLPGCVVCLYTTSQRESQSQGSFNCNLLLLLDMCQCGWGVQGGRNSLIV